MGMADLCHRQSNCRPHSRRGMARVGMIARALRRVVSADFMALALIFAALQALTYGISSSLRNTDTKYFFWICLMGALLAFGLSKRNQLGFRSSLLVIAVGVAGVWILGARLTTPLLQLANAIWDTLPQVIPAIRF